jgi:SAM-dependent methyltransferase
MKLRRAGRHWEALAKEDPLWAILAYEDKRGGRWDVDDFFATGVWEIDEAITAVTSLGIPIDRRKALDFGCGAGRLTQALAGRFEEVWGVDIAPSMIELATRYNGHVETCHYRVNTRPDLQIFEDETFGFIYSNIVLQHVEPRYQERYIDEFLRVLAPGGALVFQLPSERVVLPTVAEGSWGRLKEATGSMVPVSIVRRYRDVRRAFSNLGSGPRFEMWATPKETVTRRLIEQGGKVLAVELDDSAGDDWRSYQYIVTK